MSQWMQEYANEKTMTVNELTNGFVQIMA